MSKELEALHRIANAKNHFKYDTLELVDKDFQIVQQGLLRLEAIDNDDLNEALESLDKVNNYLNDVYDYKEIKEEVRKDINYIKQKLIKAKKQEKVLEIIFKKDVDLEWFKMRKKWTETLENQYKSYCKYIENNSYWSFITQEEFDLLKRYCDER